MKDKVFTIVDSLIDSQRKIESTADYLGSRGLAAMNKRISDPKWKYQLLYATKVTKKCAYEVNNVVAFSDALKTSSKVLA